MLLDPRAYWTEQMEAAYAFMQRLLEYPLQECGEPLISLREKAQEAGVRMSFPPGKKLGLFDRVFYVRQSLVEKLLRVAEAFLTAGYVLQFEDAYRTPQTQASGARSAYVIRSVLRKVIWELDGGTLTAEFVLRRLAAWTATTLKFANHTSGSAVDITLLDASGSPSDLGGPYPHLSHQTPMASPFISRQARRSRTMMCDLLAAEDFVPYPFEFWHFSCGDADAEMISGTGRPGRFGPVERHGEGVLPISTAEIFKPLVTAEDIRPYLLEPEFA